MHVIMQMHKYSNIIVERADFNFIMLRFLNTGTMFFFLFYFIFLLILLFIYLFLEYLSYSIVHLTLLFIILDLY